MRLRLSDGYSHAIEFEATDPASLAIGVAETFAAWCETERLLWESGPRVIRRDVAGPLRLELQVKTPTNREDAPWDQPVELRNGLVYNRKTYVTWQSIGGMCGDAWPTLWHWITNVERVDRAIAHLSDWSRCGY